MRTVDDAKRDPKPGDEWKPREGVLELKVTHVLLGIGGIEEVRALICGGKRSFTPDSFRHFIGDGLLVSQAATAEVLKVAE